MENSTGSTSLLTELIQALELVLQMEALLDQPSLPLFCKSAVPVLLSTLERSIAMSNWTNQCDGHPPAPRTGGGESPRSAAESPGADFCDLQAPFKKDASKKRKTQPKWTSQVRVSTGAGRTEGPVDDGHSWRKYGQKEILGAQHPRAYYRCTHRHTQGCMATKQVQRSDNDHLLFHIAYYGTHTCLHKSLMPPASASMEEEKQQQIQLLLLQQSHLEHGMQQQQQPSPPPPQQQQIDQGLLFSFQTGLKVKTEGLDEDEASASFSFGVGGMMPQDLLSTPSTPVDDRLNGSSCPTFLSPTTSGSTYLSASPCRVGSFDGLLQGLHSSESDFTDIKSAANSVCTSPAAARDMDFAVLETLSCRTDVQFDPCSFFAWD